MKQLYIKNEFVHNIYRKLKSPSFTQAILDKFSVVDKVELTLEENYLILKPIPVPRKNWEKALKKMHKIGDEKLLIDDIFIDELFEE